MCNRCDDNEKIFKKMMGIEINGWTWNFHSALPYVANLVTSEKIRLDKYTDTKKVAEDYGTDEHNGEDIFSLLDLFIALSKPEAELDLEACSISEESMTEFNLIPMDIENACECNPIKVARLLAEAQNEFRGVYAK